MVKDPDDDGPEDEPLLCIDAPNEVVDKISRALTRQRGICLVDDGEQHDGYCQYRIQTVGATQRTAPATFAESPRSSTRAVASRSGTSPAPSFPTPTDATDGGVARRTHPPLHQSRVGGWPTGELAAHLAHIVHTIAAGTGVCAALAVALELLAGELGTFLLFGHVGHRDPPRSDGKMTWAVLAKRSEDPAVHDRLRQAVRGWLTQQENN